MSGPAAVDIALRDGRTVRVGEVVPEDEPALRRFLESLSLEARAFRFFTGAADLGEAARQATGLGPEAGCSLAAWSGSEVVAHAMFARTGPAEAEVAFATADRFQGTGIATTLLAHLVTAAGTRGIDTFTANVLPANHRMLEVFRESGLAVSVQSRPGELHVQMAASLDAEAQRRFAERDRIAAAAGVRHVLEPRSIAVVGASARGPSIGGAIVQNLLDNDYAGRLDVVHPRAASVLGVPAARTLTALGAAPELVVVAVPAARVADVARDAAVAGAAALVVVTAGFREAGPDGDARERELLQICRAAGMRLVGPNCLGVINTDPGVRLDASFAPGLPTPGNVALLSQSGALGIAAIETARQSGIGLSSFVSVGNKADLSGNDFLQYWEQDDRAAVVMLYLESFGNPRKFARISRRVARAKPIVVVKAGRSRAGARAAQSHTGALLAASDATVDALCTQAGVIRVESLSELFDVTALLARQPAPRGRRVGILTNGGGVGILCADACEAAGLEVPELSGVLGERLTALGGDGVAVGNPVDLLGGCRTETFGAAAQVMRDSGEVDAVIVLAVGTPSADPEAVGRVLGALPAPAREGVPVAAVQMPLAVDAHPAWHDDDVPRFAFPEQAAKAVARAARYGRWRAAPPAEPAAVDGAVAAAGAAIVAEALADGGGWLSPERARRLLEAHRIPLVDQRVAAHAQAAATCAAELGFPVALKAVAPGLVHKTDVGAVALDLRDAGAVEDAATAMTARLRERGFPAPTFLVQAMAGPGPELLVGAVHDASFGPVVVCAAGGTAAEAIGDSATRLGPLTRDQAGEMLRELRTFPLLAGFRGAPSSDLDAVERLLVAVAQLADTHPEVAELDLNPVVAGPTGAIAVDARIRIEPVGAPAPAPSLEADWP